MKEIHDDATYREREGKYEITKLERSVAKFKIQTQYNGQLVSVGACPCH